MDKFELYYNFAQSQLLEQHERLKFIRTTAMSFITLNLALMGVVLLIFVNLKPDTMPAELFFGMFAVAIAISFVISVLYSLRVLYIDPWRVGAHPQELQTLIASSDYGDDEIIEWTADTISEAYRLNDKMFDEKANDLRLVIFWFWSAVVFVVALSVSAVI